MTYARSFKRPHVEDPTLAKALQQIDEEFSKLYLGLSSLGAAATFLGLTDTPSAYTGHGDKIVAVKLAEDGLEFIDAPAGGGDMTKAVYDTDDDGVVDAAETAAFASDSDKVDGQHAADFAVSGHNHALNNLSEKSYNSLTDKPTIPGASPWTTVKQSAAVSNQTTVAVDVPGLAFSLISGRRYYFKFVIQWQSGSLTRGPVWSFTRPAMTYQHYAVEGRQAGLGTGAFCQSSATDLTTTINVPQQPPAINTDTWCVIEGFCQPSENGTLQLQIAAETTAAEASVTVSQGGVGMLCDLG